MSDTPSTHQQRARTKAASAFHEREQRQVTADMKRAEDQRVAEKRMIAKTEALRALRMKRDAQLAEVAAQEAAAKAAAAPPPKKRSRAKPATVA